MHFVLMIHEVALILNFILGIIFAVKKKGSLRKTHFILGIIAVVSIIIYLIMDAFSNMGYVIYGILIVFVCGTGKYLKKYTIPVHVATFVISVAWLVFIHL